MAQHEARKRIVVIHALQDSQVPIWNAFKAGWPDAEIHNLMDDSLSADLAVEGRLTQAMIDRFLTLGRYAAAAGPGERRADAILFSCSAFGPAIEAVKDALPIPVLRPNEAAFEEALARGRKLGLMVTFAPSLPPLVAELEEMAKQRGLQKPEIVTAVAEGALAALQGGRPEEHDRIAAETAARLGQVDALVLGQFSLARAKPAIEARGIRPVITTPASAVDKLRRTLTKDRSA
jgi:Asp/Glu/hydantoin racemase